VAAWCGNAKISLKRAAKTASKLVHYILETSTRWKTSETFKSALSWLWLLVSSESPSNYLGGEKPVVKI